MKVKEIMTENPKACIPTDTLAEAAKCMWDGDCGAVPVVKDGGIVVGLITDRDICMAAAMNNRNLSNLAVEDVMSGNVYAAHSDDDVARALEIMGEHQIRRVPVINDDGTLNGMLSINDIVLRAEDKNKADINYGRVIETYKAICAHRAPLEQAQVAAV